MCCHILLDGRDVPATSALEYVQQLEDVLASLSGDGYDYRIASGGGRMTITMDRYEANWPMVELGWKTHVRGEGRQFADAKTAIETYRTETGCIDQDLPPFVIAKDGKPVGTIANGDSVILFNFRGDRARRFPWPSTARTSTSLTAATTPAWSLPACWNTTATCTFPPTTGGAPRHPEHPHRGAVRSQGPGVCPV